MYVKLFYVEKVRAEVLRRWKSQNGDIVVDAEEDEEGGDEGDADEDAETAGIPIKFKMAVAKEMLVAETAEIQEFVDTKRKSEVKEIEDFTNEDEEELTQRIAGFVRYYQHYHYNV
jgi:hypothetical protein